MTDIYCYCFVEDAPSAAVIKKMVERRNAQCNNAILFRKGFPSVQRGFGGIKKKARSFLEMARAGIYNLILTDLDTRNCAPELIQDWFGRDLLPREVIFRIAVREVESWILADLEAFADFLGISRASFSNQPDDLPDPKQYLFNVIRRKKDSGWRKEMLPRGNAHIGPRYNEKLCKFIEEIWSPLRAETKSPSLRRALRALRDL